MPLVDAAFALSTISNRVLSSILFSLLTYATINADAFILHVGLDYTDLIRSFACEVALLNEWTHNKLQLARNVEINNSMRQFCVIADAC